LKENKEKALSFLRKKLTNENIVRAFLFGSFVTEKEEPNDCDIFIVTNQTPLKDNWKQFLNTIAITKVEFLENFGLPLNASINTEKEFTEESAFRTRIMTKKTIEII
jgi:predicted nucleotidyltransferase